MKEIAGGRATCLVLENEDYHYDIINVYGQAKGTYDEYTNFCKEVFNFPERICNNGTETRSLERSKYEKQKNREKKKLGFGYNCGLDEHKIGNCWGNPNAEQFEDSQGN